MVTYVEVTISKTLLKPVQYHVDLVRTPTNHASNLTLLAEASDGRRSILSFREAILRLRMTKICAQARQKISNQYHHIEETN